MKESTLATKIMIGILCAGVLLYLALYFLLGFRDEIATTIAYDYAVDVGAEAAAVIVREETVLSSSGSYVDQVLSEGERAAAGQTVALICSDPTALDTRRAIRSLSAEIEQLQYALATGTQAVDSSRLDAQVVSSIVSLRALASSGDLSALEDAAFNLRTAVFQRDYTYGDLGAAAQIAQLIEEKQSRLTALTRSLNQVAQAVRAPASGVFSGEADGYEALITPDMLDSLTIADLSQLLDAVPPARPKAVGKLITDSTWYLAALLEGENHLSLTQGRTYTVSFSHDYYGNIPMKLERIDTDGTHTLAIFSSRSHLADTTLLRVQTVDLVVNRLEGIRIPRKALRVQTKDVTSENGVTTQQNIYGVYTVVGSQAEWQEVNVLYTGDTFYLVEPADKRGADRLRAGDTVILTSTGMYDGKVVR